MKIILQKDVNNLGQTGDIVSVKKGYARHFLLPKKWAIALTKSSLAESEHRKNLISAKKKKALSLRQSLAEKLKDLKLSFVKSADSSGKLFGSVTVFEISKALELKGYTVDKKAIKLEKPLKQTGEHKAFLDFGEDLKPQITIVITAPAEKESSSSEIIKS